MGNILVSRKRDDNHGEEDMPSSDDIERAASSLWQSIGITFDRSLRSANSEMCPQNRVLHRVPPQVREKNKHLYDPSVVSLGPYHHGQPQFFRAEKIKDEVRNIILASEDGASSKCLLFRGKIVAQIDKIRSFYGGLSTDEHKDEALTEMMLRDACLVLYLMQIVSGDGNKMLHMLQSIELSVFQLFLLDHVRLENQVPWWVIKSLIDLTYNEDEGEALICRSLSYLVFGNYKMMERVPWEGGTNEEPLHLLEAIRAAQLKAVDQKENLKQFYRWMKRMKSSQGDMLDVLIKQHYFRSVTELKAKGIHFRPSTRYLSDVTFHSHSFYGVLHLPVLLVDSGSMELFSNVIALEMAPRAPVFSDYHVVTSYIDFMKSMIESPKDVKELQEKGIIISSMDSEQIARMFKEIDTHEAENVFMFDTIKRQISEHCNSKAKTWIAELIDTYFGSPWKAIALLATTSLLCLTFLQTYFAMNPRN